MYKLRQRKAAATFRVLFYEETTGTNESFNLCSLTCSKTGGNLHCTVILLPRLSFLILGERESRNEVAG